MGIRISTREPGQLSILDPLKQNKEGEIERDLIRMDVNEVHRDKQWNSLAENIFSFPMNPKDFI